MRAATEATQSITHTHGILCQLCGVALFRWRTKYVLSPGIWHMHIFHFSLRESLMQCTISPCCTFHQIFEILRQPREWHTIVCRSRCAAFVISNSFLLRFFCEIPTAFSIYLWLSAEQQQQQQQNNNLLGIDFRMLLTLWLHSHRRWHKHTDTHTYFPFVSYSAIYINVEFIFLIVYTTN